MPKISASTVFVTIINGRFVKQGEFHRLLGIDVGAYQEGGFHLAKYDNWRDLININPRSKACSSEDWIPEFVYYDKIGELKSWWFREIASW